MLAFCVLAYRRGDRAMLNSMVFKRGDTFLLTGTVRMPDPQRSTSNKQVMVEVDLSDWQLKSEMRLGDKLIAVLEIEKRPDVSPGCYTLTCVDTSGWPISSSLVFDVQYTLPSGQVLSSDTVAVDCKKDVTR